MGIIRDTWDYISSMGLHAETDGRITRKVKLTNQIAFVAILMSFLQLFAFAEVPTFAMICLGCIPLYGVTFWLNHRGNYNFARVYFTITSCLCIAAGAGFISSGVNISARFMVIQAFVIPMVIFDHREIKLQIISALSFIMTYVLFDTITSEIPLIANVDPAAYDNPQTIIMNGVLCMITLMLGHRYLQRLNYQAENDLLHTIETTNRQRAQIEKKNEFIKEGIMYAKQIQEAVLPKKEDLKVYLPDHFVYFKPKEIIGGDFYWYGETGNHILIAAVDCTGHGAPGALISIIGSQLLDKIVKEQGITSPGEILEILNLEIISMLYNSDSVLKDGMDISLVSIDTENRVLNYAGAKNSLIVMRDGEIERIRGERASIGQSHILVDGFADHRVELEKNDAIYLLTDGVIDQFGGPKNKKLLGKRLYANLKKNQLYSMEIQQDCLKQAVELWKGTQEQTDDILVVGLRVDFDHIDQVRAFRNYESPAHSSLAQAS